MTVRARILYEDSRSETRGFMLHHLVCALVCDVLGDVAVHEILGQIDAVPRRGVDNVLRDCRERVEPMFKGLPVGQRFALIDGDELPGHLNRCLGRDVLPPQASLDQRRRAVQAACPGVQMFLVSAADPRDSNTEGLLHIVADCSGTPGDDPVLTKAIDKKSATNERDLILKRAAYGSPAVRDCVRAAQPDLVVLAEALAAVLRASRV